MVFELLEQHVSLCMSISNELVKLASFKVSGNRDETEKCLASLFEMEEKADQVRRKASTEMAKGVLPPLSREDLMRLMQRLDMVADYAKDAARILGIIHADELTEGFKMVFLRFMGKVDECVKALGSSITALLKDFKDVVNRCYEVERLEEEIDVIYVEALKVARDTNMKIQTALLATELLRLLEMEADHCEDTADLVRIITISTIK